jgi:hypothetical protein
MKWKNLIKFWGSIRSSDSKLINTAIRGSYDSGYDTSNYTKSLDRKLKSNKANNMTNSCEEAFESAMYSSVSSASSAMSQSSEMALPSVMTNSVEKRMSNNAYPLPLPPPDEFGGGNPFLMFLCLTLLLQHRDHIMKNAMDYNELAMHFDKMVRRHDVRKVLHQARQMYAMYLRNCQLATSLLSENGPKSGESNDQRLLNV